MPAGSSLADENAPGWPRRVCGKAYVASRLGLSTGKMTLIGRRDGGASMLRGAARRVRAPDRKGSFLRWTWSQSPACDAASQPTGAQWAPTSQIPNATPRRSVRLAVLVRHPPLAVDRHHGEIVVGVVYRIARGPVADFKIDDVLLRFVDEAMAVATSRLEAGAHSGVKSRPAGVRDQGRAPFEDIDELVLLRVRVAQSRAAAGRKTRDVDAEICQPEQVAEPSGRLSRPAMREANGSE
jgi:hypothetical protein